MGKTKAIKTNYAIPGNAMDQQEFQNMIKKAEKGPFYTISEVKDKLASKALTFSTDRF
jgi:hypothetical protein